jgi:ribonuclease VapC
MVVVAFDERQSAIAFDAYRRWGKDNHPAALDLGDCAPMPSPRASMRRSKGGAFAKTDVRPAA